MPLGVYISVPFCRSKCSYCNFASDVFSRAVFGRYIERLCAEMAAAGETAERKGGLFERQADSVYLGGGTPTILDAPQLQRLFSGLRQEFRLLSDAEITVECAPGTLSPKVLDALVSCGVNRVSLGVQSFVDAEAASVGRLHKRSTILEDVARLVSAGISNVSIDLIAGLPHQTAESWTTSLSALIDAGVPHASVYMLEVDDESRLGRELIAGGSRYHAHFVPDEDLTADLYLAACERLNDAGLPQYEISNFARAGCESQHNLKYWTRRPYLGLGVDAHSMLRAQSNGGDTRSAVRFSNPDSLDAYLANQSGTITAVPQRAALEELFFLGLRLNCGLDLTAITAEFGQESADAFAATIAELEQEQLLERRRDTIRLTPRGRLLSNEVFERFLVNA